ncbi:hypothetical protein AKJ48_00580 [candidate division MSBL1 archaeon SCGC-AAA261O19]|uniref:Protein FdhD n=1 Tax=candidate division MSBL1 archaeon SCGC-AAA261O19 TaxID=1698277 RepID=A0A133VF60_9EURY|nr:hypothetical protein AKJ48_00580 [candidate division MSBL1 archaeon SCGC-AAA261O19]
MEKEIIRDFESEKISQNELKKALDSVAVEESFDLLVNGTRVASLMITPSDLTELGYGYLLAEGIVESVDQIITVRVKGREIHTFIEGDEKLEELLELRSSGCVGVHWDREEQVFVETDFALTSDLIFRSLRHLETSVYDKTSGSHSASLIGEDGRVLAKTVDVGRHNAYDKIIGKAVTNGIDLSKTMLLSSGRQSAGMVMKAARVGIPIIVTKAAPLSSGIEAARKAGITLACFANNEKIKIFAGSERIKP